MQLLFKPIALGGQVVGLLGVHGVAAGGGSVLEALQVGVPHFLQALFARHDVHGQLVEVLQIHIVELIEHGHILEQLHLMVFQVARDVLHVFGHVLILGLDGSDLLLRAEEQALEALGLFPGGVEALELGDQLGQDIAHFAGIAGFHVGKHGVREAGNLLLSVRAVEHHMIRVGQINSLGERRHLNLFLVREGRIQGRHRFPGVRGLGRVLQILQHIHGLFHGLPGFLFGVQGQDGGAVLLGFGEVVFSHGDAPFRCAVSKVTD